MEGLSNEHSESVGISDCPTDWSSCGFDCSNAGEWKCLPWDTDAAPYGACKSNLPNEDKLDDFIRALKMIDFDVAIDDSQFITTCELHTFATRVMYVQGNASESDSIVHDLHTISPMMAFTTTCNHSFTDEGTGNFLKQDSFPSGGQIGGSIVGGYKDLVHWFGELDNSQSCSGHTGDTYKLKIGDLRRIDIKRRLPCDFPRDELFLWMFAFNGARDRRSDCSMYADWFAGCSNDPCASSLTEMDEVNVEQKAVKHDAVKDRPLMRRQKKDRPINQVNQKVDMDMDEVGPYAQQAAYASKLAKQRTTKMKTLMRREQKHVEKQGVMASD
jgi:hypothetical protein